MRAQEYPYFTISKTILIAVTLIFDYAEEIRHCFNDIVVLHLRVDSLYAAHTFTQFHIARRERDGEMASRVACIIITKHQVIR